MEDREQPATLEDRRAEKGRGRWLLPSHFTGFAALAAILLVAIGVGTSRRSQGSGSELPMLRLSTSPLPLTGVGVHPAADVPASIRPSCRGQAALLARDGLLSLLAPGRFGRSLAEDRPSASADAPNMRSYDGRPIRQVAVIRMRVTAYSPDERSCGASADGITASGYSVLTNGGFLVAADPRVLPLGSLVCVPGYDGGAVVPVLDTGGAIKGNRLDVLYPTHELAVQWGVQELDVEVWDYADGMPSGFRRVRRPAK